MPLQVVFGFFESLRPRIASGVFPKLGIFTKSQTLDNEERVKFTYGAAIVGAVIRQQAVLALNARKRDVLLVESKAMWLGHFQPPSRRHKATSMFQMTTISMHRTCRRNTSLDQRSLCVCCWE